MRAIAGKDYGDNTNLPSGIGFISRINVFSLETIASLSPIKEHLTDENLDILLSFEEARDSGLMRRVLLMRESGVYRQTLPGRIGLWVAVLFNLI